MKKIILAICLILLFNSCKDYENENQSNYEKVIKETGNAKEELSAKLKNSNSYASARAYFKSNNTEKAIFFYTEIIESNTSEDFKIDAYLERAICYDATNEQSNACEDVKKFADLKNKYPNEIITEFYKEEAFRIKRKHCNVQKEKYEQIENVTFDTATTIKNNDINNAAEMMVPKN